MVDQNTFDGYLKDRYEKQIIWYDEKSRHNQWWAMVCQITIIILSAVTPVFAALEFKWPTIIASAMVAALVGILRYCKFEEYWQNYRTTCETLKKEKIIFDSKISPYDKADDPTKLFIERVESMISKENTEWVQLTTKKNKKGSKE